MLGDHSQEDSRYAGLFARYQFEWQSFSRQTARWQSLKEGEQRDSTIVAEAEALVGSAEDQYRQARNALAEYVMKHSSKRA
jgi:hypothetical protein